MASHQQKRSGGGGSIQKTTYENGDTYEGGWNKDGAKEGYGKLKLTDGTVYEGGFTNGFFCGRGCLVFPDTSKYEGEFLNGKYNGFGTFTRADGMRFEGCFEEGRVLGNGLVTFADGTNGRPRCEGYFEGSRLIRQELCPDVVKKARQAANDAKRERTKNSKSSAR